MMNETFAIKEEDPDIDLSKALMLVGFPEAGSVGYVAITYLLQALPFKQIASISGEAFSYSAYCREGLVEYPLRIYSTPLVCGVDGSCNQIVVLLSEAEVRPRYQTALARTILNWIKSKSIQNVIILGGFKVADEQSDTGIIMAVASREQGKTMLKVMNIDSLYDGIITGIFGSLLNSAKNLGVNVVAVLAQTHAAYPDAHAAAQLLVTVRGLVPVIPIVTEPLLVAAKVIDDRFKIERKRQRESLKLARNESSLYID